MKNSQEQTGVSAENPPKDIFDRIFEEKAKLPRLSFPARFWGHLATVLKHKYLVAKFCFRAGIYLQGITHDLSKFSPPEFWVGVKYYQGWRSPNAVQRELFGYSSSWLHHKGRNKHHFEYWNDLVKQTGPDGEALEPAWGPVDMPARYVVEMLCDRMAACRVYMKEDFQNDSPLQYYLKESKLALPMMTEHTKAAIEYLLHTLADEGERAVFSAARKLVAQEKRGKGE